MHNQSYLTQKRHHTVKSLAANKRPGWRIALLATVIALALASVGQLPMAQAAPAGATQLVYFMTARNLARLSTICVGDVVIITVKVMRGPVGGGNPWHHIQDIPGVVVRGTVQNTDIGSLSQFENVTGWDSRYPGAADYYFTAKKPGTTVISFEGQINHIWWASNLFGKGPIVDRRDFVSDTVNVTVAECKFKVSANSGWQVEGPANLSFKATFDDVEITGDNNGHYTGSGTVTWTASSSPVGDCSGTISATPSQVDLSGDMNNESGLLVTTVTYQATTASSVSNCGNSDFSMTPDPLKFITGADGGVSTQNHLLRGPESVSGRVTIDVVPAETASTP